MPSRVETSLVDPVGVLYEGNGYFYRAIHRDSEGLVRAVMESGLVEQLIAEDLFPETRISSEQIDGFDLVLEHKKVGIPTYPFEWSPEMLRAAGLCLTRVNDVCNEYGYELKDAHPYNIVLDGCNPVFVDFGSIQLISERKRSDWTGASEFERTFRFPLYFYAKGAISLFQNAFLVPGKSYEYSDYLAFRFPWMRLLPANSFRFMTRVFQAYKRFACLDFKELGRRWVPWKRSVLETLQWLGLIPLRRQSSNSLGRKLSKLTLFKPSMWAAYHEDAGFMDNPAKFRNDERFRYVLELVKKAGPSHVTELACNQGILAEHIAQLDSVEQVICCDYDEQAIDSLFVRYRQQAKRLNPLVLDFMLPKCTALTKRVEDRIRGDMVIALAVTHHLTLTQGFSFDSVFKSIARYTCRYAIADFMPLGLWDGTYAPPLPEQYSEDEFRNALQPYFNVIEKSQVQSNRIVYFLEKTTPSNREKVV
jgi:hypothetical protein